LLDAGALADRGALRMRLAVGGLLKTDGGRRTASLRGGTTEVRGLRSEVGFAKQEDEKIRNSEG